ncbi:signal peptide peptidase SppA [Peredibacter sp. HCB2-198]|uniref:signal peptide peptidase SppA n=1 Tax=Peredibacter sp. HCB2-198 TaxID=3383025 RepID=UPI0038B48CCC
MSRERSKGIVGIFILVTVLFFVFLIFAFYTVSQLKQTTSMGEGLMDSKSAPIAVIPIENEIMESKKVVEMLIAAEEEKEIKAIILRIDSPGGAVAPTQEIYEEVRRIDKKKPIYASFGTVAASGGYYIGAATRKIWANAGTLTGSIGVIMQMADLSELFAWAKYKQETIKAGRYKDIGNPGRPMTEEERAFLNTLLAGTHKQFMDDISAVRKDRLKKDITELAQGQIFHGMEAKELGLVDEVGSLWQAGRAIHKEMKLEGKFALRYMKPARKKFSISEFLQDTEDTLSFIRNKVETKTTPAFLFKP